MSLAGLRSTADRRAAAAAAAASTVIIAMQLAGKSTRDALLLSTFGVKVLPPMVIAAAVLSMVLTIGLARVMARMRPGRLIPRLYLLSAVLLVAEWMLAAQARQAAAILIYLHITGLGALLVSGFWAMVNERFDPSTARRTIGQITAGGSLGGLLGGILPERVGTVLPLTAMLPILACLQLLAGGLVLGMENGARPESASPEPVEDTAPAPAVRILRNSSYLMGLALLVALTSTAEGVLDYVFKARVTVTTTSGEELLRLFAAFYTTTALLGIFIQVSFLRRLLGKLGIARSAGLLPAGVSVGAVGALFLPGLVSIVVARGLEVILRSSLFRAAYELFFTPIAPPEKRATKLLLDVGAARVGDVAGGALILGALAVAGAAVGQVLLVLTFALSIGALFVARRLQRGYVGALEGSLHRRAGPLPDSVQDDAAALLQTVGAFDLSGIRARAFGIPVPQTSPEAPSTTAAAPLPQTPLDRAIRSGDPHQVRDALSLNPLAPGQVETAIELLAWNDVAPNAIRALSTVAGRHTPLLLQHLLDPDEDFAIRRRLINALADCRTVEVFEGFLQALDDRRFEVRYRAGRALSRIADDIAGIQQYRERVLSVILREMTVERGVWESRRLIDAPDEGSSPMEAELLRDRANRSLEHLFTLLSLIFPRDIVRLAFHGLHAGDPYLRGTALEYLDTVLPEAIWAKLWPLLDQGEPKPIRSRKPEQALQDLLATRESVRVSLAEAREVLKADQSARDENQGEQ
jgi:AAA family ATP:ADP antiporter